MKRTGCSVSELQLRLRVEQRPQKIANVLDNEGSGNTPKLEVQDHSLILKVKFILIYVFN